MTDATGTTHFGSTPRGELGEEVRTLNNNYGTFRIAWGYNSAGLLDWMTYPGDNQGSYGETVDYSYTSQLTLESLTSISLSDTYVVDSQYDAAGRLVQRRLGSQAALLARWGYNPWSFRAGRLAQITAGVSSNPGWLLNLSYDYDPAGNPAYIYDTSGIRVAQMQTFGYDALDRLTSAQTQGTGDGQYSQPVAYDPVIGNLSSKDGMSFTYGDTSHRHAVTTLSSGASFGYDANGNMTSRHVYNNGWKDYTLAYDGDNHLVGVSGSATASYAYDGDGKRIWATQGGTTTLYIGNYYEWVAGGTASTAKRYYNAGSTRVAMRTGTAAAQFILGDHLGSTSLIADANGVAVSGGLQMYKAWGENRGPASTSLTKYQYTGQFNDSYIGLYFYGSRWYDSSLGRFVQADTDVTESQDGRGLDRYAYVANNPVVFDDPSGHCWGVASGIRGVPGYGTTCQNMDAALSIVQHPEASYAQKAGAGAYIAAEVLAHAAVVAGVGALGCAAIGPACSKVVEGALGIGAGASADGDPTNEVSAAAKTAESVLYKLDTYLLEPTHPRGGTMAVWYEKALGFTKQNMGDLAKQIVFNPKTAYQTAVSQYGVKYNQIISVTGANGKVIDIVAAWIKLPDGIVTLYDGDIERLEKAEQ